jgi:hypothetical protein
MRRQWNMYEPVQIASTIVKAQHAQGTILQGFGAITHLQQHPAP